MTKIEYTYLERTLSLAFSGGEVTERELRLTDDEVDYLRATWPAARVTPMAASTGGKSWYEVHIAQ